LGDNAKAALISRGLAEMARLGEACGARPETFAGLAGMGDLIVTCWHQHGRNRRAGELIARGASPEDAAAEIGTVEGLTTAPVLRDLSHRFPGRNKAIAQLEKSLSDQNVDYNSDIKPALGSEVDVAVANGATLSDVSFAALTKPDDPAKFKALIAKMDKGGSGSGAVYR